jgi:hypothetical protein
VIKLLSPTACAEAVISEIASIQPLNNVQRGDLVRLLRQLVRDNYETCAAIAENYVAEHDLYEDLDGLQVGDAIAEKLRLLADDRANRRDCGEKADAPLLGSGG